MLDLSTENKALCFEDSTLKPLYIFLYYWQEDSLHQNGGWWQYFTTVDEAIVLESAEVTEGVLEGNNFELGSFVVPFMKVQWQNNGIRYKDMVAVPVQKIGDEYIAYFDGYISSEEISQDGQTVSAEIVSFLGERLDIDVLENLKQATGTTFANILQYSLSSNAGIWLDENKLLSGFGNANTIININTETLPQTLTAKELLKQAGEFLGAHIVVKEKRVVDIDNMKTYQPSGLPIIDFIRFANVDTVANNQIKPLPSGYKRVEYIQTDGTQYINTGYIPNSNTKVEIDIYNLAKYLDVSNPANPIIHTTALFGSRTAVLKNSFLLWLSATELNNFVFDISNLDVRIFQKVFGKQKIIAKSNRIEINGLATSINVNSFEGEYPLYLFSTNTAGTHDERCALVKLYSFKIYENDILQRDMIPCVRTSDNKLGLYDIINGNFYVDENGSDFIAPNPIETHTLPYYINLYADKTNKVKFDQIRVLTQTGDSQSGQRNYTFWWNDDVKTTYEIKNNIFFESLSTQYWWYCEKAVTEVGSYLESQNLYYTDLQTVYPPFIEGGDYLIVKGKNQSILPSGYSALDYVEIKKETAQYFMGIVTNVLPDSNNIAIDIDFSFSSNQSVIFEADARNENGTILMLTQYKGALSCFIGNWYIDDTPAFNIPYAPKNQKLNLKICCGNGRYEYNGSFSGSGTYKGDDVIYTKKNSIMLGTSYGRDVDFKLYHFAYSQGGEQLCDMYPCIRESDGAIGVYDIVQNAFIVISGNPKPNYESADIVIPTLSITSKGIHSMRADILCKATNTNKN